MAFQREIFLELQKIHTYSDFNNDCDNEMNEQSDCFFISFNFFLII